MPNFRQLMEHEEHQWSCMTDVQLLRRLQKITQPQKLHCFALMASRRGATHLKRQALERAVILGIDLPWGASQHSSSSYSMGSTTTISSTTSPSTTVSASQPPEALQRYEGNGPASTAGLLSAALSLSFPELKKPKKKKPIRHIRFNKGDS